jgi:ABC-type uncharacterized transport system permease subunit
VSEAGAEHGSPWLRRLRLCLAFLLPAAVGGFVGATILSLTVFSDMISTSPPDEQEVFRITLSGMIFIGTFLGATWGQLATALVGLPAHVWLMHYTQRRSWMYAAAGAVAGIIFGAIFVGPPLFGQAPPTVADLAMALTASAIAGAAGGLTFWLIRRPDRDVHPGRKSAPTQDIRA